MELTPITDFDFLQKLKGCGIKYYSKIPRTQLKALLGFCPKTKRKIEIESKIYESVAEASRKCEISTSAVKYALDHKKPSIKRRSDQKIFYIREILIFFNFFVFYLKRKNDRSHKNTNPNWWASFD